MQKNSRCRTKKEDPGSRIEERSRENARTIRRRRRNVRDGLLADTLRIPADVCEGTMRITMSGNNRAWVENYRGILEYTEHSLLLQGKTGRVCFEGEALCIEYYTEEDMLVRGRIRAVRYQDE